MKGDDYKDKCPRCGQETIIPLSNPHIGGGVLLCTKCKSSSPFAETTIKAMAEWEDSIRKI